MCSIKNAFSPSLMAVMETGVCWSQNKKGKKVSSLSRMSFENLGFWMCEVGGRKERSDKWLLYWEDSREQLALALAKQRFHCGSSSAHSRWGQLWISKPDCKNSLLAQQQQKKLTEELLPQAKILTSCREVEYSFTSKVNKDSIHYFMNVKF